MSLLVPDYAPSSSEDETVASDAVPPAVSALSRPTRRASPVRSNEVCTTSNHEPQRTERKRKAKRLLYLPPEIQRLLEKGTSGGAVSDDSDEERDVLEKQRQVKRAASTRLRPVATDQDSILSFLPPPKHAVPVSQHETNGMVAPGVQEQEQGERNEMRGAHTGQEEGARATAAAAQQYDASYLTRQEYYVAEGEADVSGRSSKRRRTREREIERALEAGHLETVTGQIVDVHGPSPTTWQPSDHPAHGSSDQVVRVEASFWNARAGMNVSTIKPSRLQRQKHQLNQLAFDAKARDMELQEKRYAASRTKRETYAKYGW
ncbi:hypothetical protein PsorP6_013498 [Peronosclerospora sorghi]|uniref:Uncharacterized protein n=1 Tax=Peronosclerospora sorghi TaxID=230839 RepID=A0ACC0VFG9_9STRA|nr:hypothetical protein PsorP6_013498 [Peronosclerospora sorghi]